MVGVRLEDCGENVKSPLLVPFLLAIERGDGQVHPDIEPVGMGGRHAFEDLTRLVELVLAHEADTAVVGGDTDSVGLTLRAARQHEDDCR